MRNYIVCYKLHSADEVKEHITRAKNKEDAYVQATFYDIPYITGEQPYSTWVDSVILKNGTKKRFNTFEGNPY